MTSCQPILTCVPFECTDVDPNLLLGGTAIIPCSNLGSEFEPG